MDKITTQSIINYAISLNPTEKYYEFQRLKTSFWFSNGNHHYPSVSSKSDVYVFEDLILVLRKQHFLFFSWVKGLIISYRNLDKEFGDAIESYFPTKFAYWEQRRMEVQIQIKDCKYDHISAVLTLKGLSVEQIAQIKSFEERFKQA